MVTTDGTPLVLVVDDEADVADTYALRLQGEYETRVAYGGEEALEQIDDRVDAVLLDRRMPDVSGDEVLDRIRERGYDCVVIMSTAVDPDLNILEMDFDDYLCKPIFRETLLETLDQNLDQPGRRPDVVEEFFSLLSKIDVLKTEYSEMELREHEGFQQLQSRADELAPQVREQVDDFEGLLETYRSIEREPS